MSNVSSLFRSLLIYSVCLPLAVVLGYLITQPPDWTTVTVVGLVFFLLLTPLLLRWHHAWLVASWNASFYLVLLPASAWLGLAWISLLIAVLQYTLNRKNKFLPVGPMVRPLVLLVVVVLVTARFRGGIGLMLLGGSSYGGKNYVLLLTAIAAFFALTARRFPPERVLFFVGLFFLGQLTFAMSELSSMIGSGGSFLSYIFPASSSASGDPGNPDDMARHGSLAIGCFSVIWFMLARYGIENIFTWRRLGRLALFAGLVFVSLYGGFRSMLIIFLLTFAILFYLEGLLRKPMLPAMILITMLGAAVLVPFANRLPLTMQRTLTFLPLRLDPVAQTSADISTKWRLEMWMNVLPQIPTYLLLGKGYSINAADFQMEQSKAMQQGGTYGTEMAGDYHNGPLSVIIPFGIFGAAAFLWLLAAGFKVLRQNYLYGDPAFRSINRFLLGIFSAKIIFFFVIFGGLAQDLAFFLGLVGIGICVNGGVAEPVAAPQPKLVYDRFKLRPPSRPSHTGSVV